MAESHVVSALKAKRAELAGEVEAAEKRIDQLRADLVHVDAVLRMYQPDLLPEAIPPRHQRPRDDWFGRGELARRIADTLREAGEPLCAREIALRIMVAKGLNPNDRELAAAFTKRSHQALRRRLRAGGAKRTRAWADGVVERTSRVRMAQKGLNASAEAMALAHIL